MVQNISRKEILNQVNERLLPALTMLDLRGTDDKVTMALMIVKETLSAILEEKGTTPLSVYESVLATIHESQFQEV